MISIPVSVDNLAVAESKMTLQSLLIRNFLWPLIIVLISVKIAFGVKPKIKSMKVCTDLCGDTTAMLDDCFNLMAPNFMPSVGDQEHAYKASHVISQCIEFRRSMRACIKTYIDRCYENSTSNDIYDERLYGSTSFINAFCNYERFDTAHIRHEDCFLSIHEDTKICQKELVNGTLEEGDLSKVLQSICCSEYTLNECVFRSAKYKCDRRTALQIWEALGQVSYDKFCRQYDRELLCSADTIRSSIIVISLVSIIVMFLYNSH